MLVRRVARAEGLVAVVERLPRAEREPSRTRIDDVVHKDVEKVRPK